MFLRSALTPELLESLGGENLQTDFLSSSRCNRSGKMKTLEKLLSTFYADLEKTLIFSRSVATLDLIEAFIRGKGWKWSRLDGKSAASTRQGMVDSFNKDPSLLIFLISTKAGGVGLNLASASKVIIFDCNWNPSLDMQVPHTLVILFSYSFRTLFILYFVF
jgi:SNF2 family DNA or RNA helicase